MPYSTKADRNDTARMFLILGVMGALATIVAIAGELLFRNESLTTIGKAVSLISIGLLVPGRDKDEYLKGLWHAGANMGLIFVIFWTMIAPLATGFYDGFTGAPREFEFPYEAVFIVLSAGFFAGFNWHRFRGAQ